VLADEVGGPDHRIGGFAGQVQGDLQVAWQLASNGIDPDDADDESDEASELLAGASAWQLLLQVDSDAAVGLGWGDCGRLFYGITDADLRAARFDRAWLLVQEF
jgi:hypothetical protein